MVRGSLTSKTPWLTDARRASLLKSHFLALPLEIRREIYKILFEQDKIRPLWRYRPVFSTSLLRACRQIHSEAAHVLYSNVFVLEESDYFYPNMDGGEPTQHIIDWLMDIGPMNRGLISRLRLDWSHEPWSLRVREDDSIVKIREAMRIMRSERMLDATVKMFRGLQTEFQEYIVEGIEYVARECRSIRDLWIYVPGCGPGFMRGGTTPLIWPCPSFDDDPRIRSAIASIRGVQRLNLGYTCKLDLAEEVAVKMGTDDVYVSWHDGDYYDLCGTDTALWAGILDGWTKEGWKVEFSRNRAIKTFRT